MSFLSGLKSVFGKIEGGLVVSTQIAQAAEPGIALVPGYGPAIVTAIQAAIALESLFPQPGMGSAKLPLATAAVQQAQPGVTSVQAAAIVNAVVAGLNSAATAAKAAAPTPPAVPPAA